jgi:hypothetical protein
MKALYYTIGSIFILVALAIVVFVVASGAYLPRKYWEPWNKGYAYQFEDPRTEAVAHGLLAANSHNMQAWKIQLDEKDKDSFTLYADSDRLTPQVDIYSRQIVISQGTFLEYVRVAAGKLGYNAIITLFPQDEFDANGSVESIRNKPVASVTLKGAEVQNSPLYDAMFLPDTSRTAYLGTQPSPDQVKQLLSLNTDEKMSLLILQDKKDLDNLGKIAMEAATVEASVPRIAKETAGLFRLNEYEKNKYRYGFSLEGQGFSEFSIFFVQSLISLFPGMNDEKATADTFLSSTKNSVDNTPAYVLMITKDNSRTSQVKTGMLYSRFQLTAQTMGFAVQPLSQALEEYPEMKTLYDKIHAQYAAPGQTIQMLARLGKPVQQVSPGMRRDVMELIVK